MRVVSGPGSGRGEVPLWLVAAVLATTGLSVGLAFKMATDELRVSPLIPLAVTGVVVALVAVRGPRSAPVALVAVGVGAVVVTRAAGLSDTVVTRDVPMLGWLAATLAALVFANRMATTAQVFLAPPPGRPPRPDPGRAVSTALVSVVAVVALGLMLWPLVTPFITPSAASGQGPRAPQEDSGGTALMAQDRADMTTRPDPTDEILLRITSERGMFWRGQVFDQWDGRFWSRADPGRFDLGPGGEVFVSLLEQPVRPERTTTQRVRVEATFSDLIFGAASPTRVEAPGGVVQYRDATLALRHGAMGRGASYTVESTSLELSPERLRAARGETPFEITERYTAEPVITERVREAALAATAGATTTYDKVRALEAWMGERTEYSLEAPLAPAGVDVVDHFLFESRRGWCQQVASSLVVMARANGIPARLATGFVPGDRDRVTGTWLVRAREYHAWTEVWFPDIGWVTFDPTAAVPLAPPVEQDRGLLEWLRDNLVAVVVGAVLVVVAIFGGRWLWRWWGQRRELTAVGPPSWARRIDRRLTQEGERLGRPRRPGETASTFADSLGRHVGLDGLAGVGLVVDRHLFAPVGPGPTEEQRAEEILDRLTVLAPEPDR